MPDENDAVSEGDESVRRQTKTQLLHVAKYTANRNYRLEKMFKDILDKFFC